MDISLTKNNIKKAYILTVNSPDGYKRIKAVFTNREKAQRAYEEARNRILFKITVFYKIEEFELQK